jgi:hypothetical protein
LGVKATLGVDSSLVNVDTEFDAPQPAFPGPIGLDAGRPPTLAEFIPAVRLRDWSVSYLRETVNATGAAETVEGELYPEADVALTRVQERLRKVGVLLPVTDDLGALDRRSAARAGHFARAESRLDARDGKA